MQGNTGNANVGGGNTGNENVGQGNTGNQNAGAVSFALAALWPRTRPPTRAAGLAWAEALLSTAGLLLAAHAHRWPPLPPPPLQGNTGNQNQGQGNTGNQNAGQGNTGNQNAGQGNTGNQNAGQGNTGAYNAGQGNTGCGLSGTGLSGNNC